MLFYGKMIATDYDVLPWFHSDSNRAYDSQYRPYLGRTFCEFEGIENSKL